MGEGRLPLAIIFDFDLTLADSSVAVEECVRYALYNLGLPLPDPNRVRRTIGLSLEKGLEYLTGETDPELQGRFRALFVRRADKVMVDQTVLIDGARSTLEFLRDQGVKTGIVSTKYRYRINAILDRQGILEQIDRVVGGEDIAAPKPDPEGLKLALRYLDTNPRNAAFVGDHLVDAEAAGRAGVPFIGVLTGTTPEEDFSSFPYVKILPSVGGLPDFLRSQADP